VEALNQWLKTKLSYFKTIVFLCLFCPFSCILVIFRLYIPSCPICPKSKHSDTQSHRNFDKFFSWHFVTQPEAGIAGLVRNWQTKRSHPVINVSWLDVQHYLKWLNAVQGSSLPEGYIYRLPTEAEWEKAARGKKAFRWPWGDEFDALKCNSSEGRKDGTTPVGSYSPQGDSPYGCADLAGKVIEWTQSLNKRYPYNPKDGRESASAVVTVLSGRITRGGSFRSDKEHTRSVYRFKFDARDSRNDVSFRGVVAPWPS
jgi:formylglycine-generating enzyme required for sulfatase activity